MYTRALATTLNFMFCTVHICWLWRQQSQFPVSRCSYLATTNEYCKHLVVSKTGSSAGNEENHFKLDNQEEQYNTPMLTFGVPWNENCNIPPPLPLCGISMVCFNYNTNNTLYLVTMGSAAWLGPHLPSNPLPTIPVLPTGFLQNIHSHSSPYMAYGDTLTTLVLQYHLCCSCQWNSFY